VRVVVGRIGRPHGVRGEVTIESRTDEPDVRFREGARLEVDAPIGTLEVERAHWHSGRLLLAFAGVNDRTAAEALRGLLLHVERGAEEAPEDPEEFYDSALIGIPVQRADGSAVGEVCDVVHLPAQDLLVVRLPDDREVLVPFVQAIVPVVDPAGRRIVIDPPPGLLDDAD
jgi:16S rRNA processing protein RimM